jgi:raffinose/stachyose/melibiose transport system substrate-binding protein
MSAAIPSGSPKEEAAWRLIKYLVGKDVETLNKEHGMISTPVRTDLDYSLMSIEPLIAAIGNLGQEYTTGTAVIDVVFHSDVFNPLNDGLQEIGLGTKTPRQVAADVQKAFDAGRAAGKF